MLCKHEAQYISLTRYKEGKQKTIPADQVRVPIPGNPEICRMYYVKNVCVTTYPQSSEFLPKYEEFLLSPSVTRTPAGSTEEHKWYFEDEFD